MDASLEETFRQREATILEEIFRDGDSPGSAESRRYLVDTFARRVLMMQTSRGDILQTLSPTRHRKLSIAECKELNVNLNVFYFQLASALDNLARALQHELGIIAAITENGVIDAPCDLFHAAFDASLHSTQPHLSHSLKHWAGWAMEFRKTRDPRALETPLYVVPQVADDDDVVVLQNLATEAGLAKESRDFEAYQEKVRQAYQLGTYCPLLAASSPDGLQLWHLPGQVFEDEGAFLSVAEAILPAFAPPAA